MKKKSHYFEVYINRVLKQSSDTNTLTLDAKQQLNSFICIFINRLSSDINKLLSCVNKKICTTKEVSTVLSILLNGQLLINCLSEGENAVSKYKAFEKTDKFVSKSQKAGIIFPPNLIERFLKKHHIMISKVSLVSIYIASVCEYITHEILDITVLNSNSNNLSSSPTTTKHRSRIDTIDLDNAVKNDDELYHLFKSLNLSFLVTGSIGDGGNNKPILFKTSFERLVRRYTNNAKITKPSINILQTYIEKYTIDLLTYASSLATHSNRTRVIPSDIKLIYDILQHRPFRRTATQTNNNFMTSSISSVDLLVI